MVGDFVIEVLGPVLESLEPIVPGEWFPLYFIRPYLQRPLIAAVFVAMVAGFLGSFLLIRNLALIGDGLAHVSFGAIAIGLVVGIVDPLVWAFVLCVMLCSYPSKSAPSERISSNYAATRIALNGAVREQRPLDRDVPRRRQKALAADSRLPQLCHAGLSP